MASVSFAAVPAEAAAPAADALRTNASALRKKACALAADVQKTVANVKKISKNKLLVASCGRGVQAVKLAPSFLETYENIN